MVEFGCRHCRLLQKGSKKKKRSTKQKSRSSVLCALKLSRMKVFGANYVKYLCHRGINYKIQCFDGRVWLSALPTFSKRWRKNKTLTIQNLLRELFVINRIGERMVSVLVGERSEIIVLPLLTNAFKTEIRNFYLL